MRQTLKVINELKDKGLINDYAIGGGIAALFYIEPFLTYDLDVFIISVERADELEKEAVENAKVMEYEGIKAKVITPEYLIVILLRAGRKKDIEKIERLLEQTDIDRTRLEEILNKFGLKERFKFLKEF